VTPGAPWLIKVDTALRARIVGEAPACWVGLGEAARSLRVARQTVLDRVPRGKLNAVHVTRGRRRGLAIELPPDQAQLRVVDGPAPRASASVAVAISR
jgi:hypothetical protein